MAGLTARANCTLAKVEVLVRRSAGSVVEEAQSGHGLVKNHPNPMEQAACLLRQPEKSFEQILSLNQFLRSLNLEIKGELSTLKGSTRRKRPAPMC